MTKNAAAERICDGRVCVVTGAGRGIGRSHALGLAGHGARVVVNDVGGERDGSGADSLLANQIVEEIRSGGGEAMANTDDISTWDGAQRLVEGALEKYGRIDVVVNNAGIIRDRMLVNMSEEDWDAVIAVHLKGTFCVTRHVAQHWRNRAKEGEENDARIINTTSGSGLYGNVGQSNYAAAKAAIAAFTQVVAEELARYGVTANAIAPVALTRMTADLGIPEEITDLLDPGWITPVVVWLASPLSAEVTGQVFEASGQTLAVAEGWRRGPQAAPTTDPVVVGDLVPTLLAQARPRTTMADL
ncbi:MAG: SDR family oxidoreductase [Acidimicrobiales bacterium]